MTSKSKRAKGRVPTKQRKPEAQKTREDYQDICTTCIHVDGCMNAVPERRPIYFCEEFDDYTPRPETRDLRVEVAVPKTENPGEHTGICMNCDHRETCMSSSIEGGIWHCEEYR